METQTKSRNDPENGETALAERVRRLESRVDHLEKQLGSIAKMESALSRLFAGKEPEES